MTVERDPRRRPLPAATGDPDAGREDLNPWAARATLAQGADQQYVVRVGAGTTGLLGWSAAELRVVSGWDLTHPDDRDRLANALAPRPPLVAAPFTPLCLRMLGRDRRYWWTRWDVRPACGASGVLATGVDFLHPDGEVGPPVGTWLWDVDDDVVSWSPELLDIVSLPVGPPVSCSAFLAAVLDDDRGLVRRAIERALATRRALRRHVPLPHAERARPLVPRHRSVRSGARRAARRLGGLVKYLNPPASVRRPADTIGSG